MTTSSVALCSRPETLAKLRGAYHVPILRTAIAPQPTFLTTDELFLSRRGANRSIVCIAIGLTRRLGWIYIGLDWPIWVRIEAVNLVLLNASRPKDLTVTLTDGVGLHINISV